MLRLMTILFLAFVSQQGFAFNATPLMGNYKIVKAVCNGEEVIWKKHNLVTITGEYLVLKGNYSSVNLEDECQFEDIYGRFNINLSLKNNKIKENSDLTSIKRSISCASGESKEVKVDTPMTKFSAEKSGHSLAIKIDERNLCQGDLTLILDYALE